MPEVFTVLLPKMEAKIMGFSPLRYCVDGKVRYSIDDRQYEDPVVRPLPDSVRICLRCGNFMPAPPPIPGHPGPFNKVRER